LEVVAVNDLANAMRGLNYNIFPMPIVDTMISSAEEVSFGSLALMDIAAEVILLVANHAFLHSLITKHAIPSGWFVTGFCTDGFEAFRSVRAALPKMICQPARCAT